MTVSKAHPLKTLRIGDWIPKTHDESGKAVWVCHPATVRWELEGRVKTMKSEASERPSQTKGWRAPEEWHLVCPLTSSRASCTHRLAPKHADTYD